MGKNKGKINIDLENGLPLIDCHCHIPWINSAEYIPISYERQYTTFFEQGGVFLISSAVDLPTFFLIKTFTNTHENMRISAGWAPQTVTYTLFENHEQAFLEWLEYIKNHKNEYIGIGEIGLDFHHAKSLDQRNRQIEVFKTIIQKTKGLNKPYILHVRNPGINDKDQDHPNHQFNQNDSVNHIILEILTQEKINPEQVIWHCFSGPIGWGKKLADLGYMLSVPSSAYGFKKWRNFIENVPITHLLTETDSEYQHPLQYGEYNTPINVKYSIAAIAQLNNLTQKEIAFQIIKNANKIFNLDLKSEFF